MKTLIRELIFRKKLENPGMSHTDITRYSDCLSFKRKAGSGIKQGFEFPITEKKCPVLRF